MRLCIRGGALAPLPIEITIPPSKSHTMRALSFALMADGVCTIRNPLPSPDTEAMLRALTALGAHVERMEGSIVVQGTGGAPAQGASTIDVGNSGQVLRFIGALAALGPARTLFTGDASVQTLRPAGPLIEGLMQLGAKVECFGKQGYAPFAVQGPIRAGKVQIDGADSQPVSALLMATSFLQGPSEIVVHESGETPWIEMTLWWLQRFGLHIECENFRRYFVRGSGRVPPFETTIPGDFSTASYAMAAALLTGSELRLLGLDAHDVQGDRRLIEALVAMGAEIAWEQQTPVSDCKSPHSSLQHLLPPGNVLALANFHSSCLRAPHLAGRQNLPANLNADFCNQTLVVKGGALKGMSIDVNPMIDALPLLAVLGCFAKGKTELCNAQMARCKESDRIRAIATELKKMGAKLDERADGLVIYESPLRGAQLFSHHDHRIALSLVVAALGAKGETMISECGCIAKSYPTFLDHFRRFGVEVM